jgi:hypothetical protein
MTTIRGLSPNYNFDDWQKLRLDIEADWQAAIEMLCDRIRGRFFVAIDRMKDYEYAGFAVLALDCLLIETLEQFYQGVAETPYRKEEEYFRNFLTRPPFASAFDNDKAAKFYKLIRCGILHQAEVKLGSLVLRGDDKPLVRTNGKGIEINRRLFHETLVQAFEDYTRELRNPANTQLRDKFRTKMNAICTNGSVC